MAFNAANLSVSTRIPHDGGTAKVFDYTTSDSKNDTQGSTYFDTRFFSGGDIIKVAYSGGSYVAMWTTAASGVSEV